MFLQKKIQHLPLPRQAWTMYVPLKHGFETKNIRMRSVRVSVPKNPEPSQSNRIEGSNPILWNPILRIGM